MHSAPSVMFPVGRCIWYGVALGVLACMGACALGAWFWFDARQGHPLWPGVVGSMVWLVWMVFATLTWFNAPAGHLKWSSAHLVGRDMPTGAWHWHGAACPEGAELRSVECVLDLQVAVLLRLQDAHAQTHWIWAERGRDPARWNSLRRAMMAAGG